MPFAYERPATGALRQGEVLQDVWIHRTRHPASEVPEGTSIQVEPTRHRWIVTLHAECDLLHDFQYRNEEKAAARPVDEGHFKIVPGVICCDAFPDLELRLKMPGSDIWKRAVRNQDERYHFLASAPVEGVDGPPLPQFVLDFRRFFTVFTPALYEGIDRGNIRRTAVVPPIYRHDLMHRFFGYLSRVGVPE